MAAEQPPGTGFWSRLDRLLAAAETALLVILLLRNLADAGLAGAEPVMRVAVLWIALLGAMVATRQRRHVSVDLLSRYLAPGPRRASVILIDGFSAAVCGLIAWHSARLVYYEYTIPTLAISAVPVWLAQAILPLGFGLIALRYLVQLPARLSGRRGV